VYIHYSKHFLKSIQSILSGLKKTSQNFVNNLLGTKQSTVTMEQMLTNLENALYRSDVGIPTTKYIMDKVIAQRESLLAEDNSKEQSIAKLKSVLRQEMLNLFNYPAQRQAKSLRMLESKYQPTVLMVVGVNGVGKTTTIGKLCYLYKNTYGREIVIAAADTTRAAAVEQLEIWGQRNDIHVIARQAPESSPKKSSVHLPKSVNIRQVFGKISPDTVVYDAFQYVIQQQKSNATNIPNLIVVDTAGRLQTNSTSMEELYQIYNVCSKARKGAPDAVWLVLDANIGQNSIDQAKEFTKKVRVNGIIMTKLDGSAKGGVILGIAHVLKLPILYLGVGENLEDLKEFEPESYVDSILNFEQQREV
jgi:fused signal recognition particle receptor